jgi:hypothetical protein
MVFMIELDGETVACSSARCVQSLLRQGWRLSDPGQKDELVQLLAREEVLTPIDLPHARSN